MRTLSRRSLLAGSAALVAAPALAAVPYGADVDVAIIGAGAAGIAAARRVAAANRRFALFEAGPRVGGRCITDMAFFGVPFDLGAHVIHNPGGDPLVASAANAGLDIYPAPRAQSLRVGLRPARDAELESFLGAQVRSHRAVADTVRGKADLPAERALPRDLGAWKATVEFILGPFACGKDLDALSAVDLARTVERESEAYCRQGYGTLLARLAAGLQMRLSTPVTRVAWDRGLEVESAKGRLRARALIVTVSTNTLASSAIAFSPALPKRQLDAAAKLTLGSFDHIALDMPGNPLNLQRDDLVFEQASGARTAALLGNVSGTSLHVVEVGGRFGRELAAKGGPAMVDFAREWIGSLFGSDAKTAIKRSRATRWNDEPFVLGAMSGAAPGAADARKVLMEQIGGKLWLAGEAIHETKWGTVAGAWESGVRAAEAALHRIGALKPAKEEKPARTRRRRRGEDD